MDPSPRPHVVLVASPCAGHVTPMAELARRLVSDHGCAATFVTFAGLAATLDAHSAAAIVSLPASSSSVAAVTLPEVNLDDLVAAGANIGVQIFELVRRSIPHLRDLLLTLAGVAALVPDFFCAAALDFAVELGVPGYVFFPINVTTLACMRRFVEVHDGAASGEYRDLPDPLRLAGSDVTIAGADIPDGFLDRSMFEKLLDAGRRYRRADGLLVNSFAEMEIAAVEDFKKGTFPPVYPVGPFVRSISDEAAGAGSACLDWLDRQPAASVVYVSFGSAGMLSVSQTRELAAGLEMSGHGFLWVVRMPSLDGGESYDFATGHRDGDADGEDPLDFLPEGFVERTRGRGLAVATWTPQVRVLAHRATAAFVSHCGWNSVLESVSAGVPMVAWPLYAEQKVNAVVLTEMAGVALPLARRGGDGDGDGVVVRREEIAAAVKEVMDPNGEKGSAARRRARELQAAAARAPSPEGASRRVLEEVAGKWKNSVKGERR